MANKNIVAIKVGTHILTANGSKLNRSLLSGLTEQLVYLRMKGYKPVLVSSGAVAAGKEVANLSKETETTTGRQVYAAVGQARLMHEYEKLFRQHRVNVGQVLLTRDDFSERSRYDNALRTLKGLLTNDIVPIINENDVIAVHELSFGDNDVLAAATAIAIDASRLLLLTNQEGVMTENPETESNNAKLIREVNDAQDIFSAISDDTISTHGIGGMYSKVNAAQIAASAGITTWIASGLIPNNISKIIADEKIGTKFIAKECKLSAKDRWILCAKNTSAGVMVDKGAAQALQNRKSLLMVGVKSIQGSFGNKEIIEVLDQNKQVIGFGVVNYSSKELIHALDNPKILKREVIHVDNLRVL
ncbi:glutamate 5-kinase [Patescibacteria group bacterium]|nr:glutamate 5-kinase [Patescibacteria group bacterium]